jgi:uncharacterized protein (DUF2336 family)
MSDKNSLIVELEDAIAAGSPAARLEALTKITDIFLVGSGRHSSEGLALLDDAFMALVDTIEANARAQLSRQLASAAGAPPKVIRRLAFDEDISVAAPVLANSDRLTEQDLVENARTMGQNHLRALSQRDVLTEPVTDVLIERGDKRVVHLVVRNLGARFSDSGYGQLVERAAKDEGLTRYLGGRKDIPRHHFLKLLESASAEARARLIADNPELAEKVQTAVSKISNTISEEVRATSGQHARAKTRIKRLCRSGQFREADLHAFAAAHDFERTALALAKRGDYPIELVERALIDPAPDMAMVLGRAAECCRATVRAILLMRSADRGLSPMDLEKALSEFDRLQIVTARRAVEFYRMRLQAEDNANVPTRLALSWYAEALPEGPVPSPQVHREADNLSMC